MMHWETWHYLAKYIPLAPAWLWYCLRSGSWWFFTPSNPTLTFGGFEGESKKEMYDQLPAGTYPRSIYIHPSLCFSHVKCQVAQHGFAYPFAVKPDIGMMGLMFRTIDNEQQLQQYHAAINTEYIVQELVTYPLEVSVFYYRLPNAATGTITGFLQKEFLEVTGDGKTTLWNLIKAYPRVAFRLDEMKAKHESKLDSVISAGKIYRLSHALNLSRGGKLVSLAHEKDSRLLQVFNDLYDHNKSFHYGRYDIKCSSIEDLKQGKNFSILEYNGCGAEPHHIYGNGYNLLQAYAIVLHHWRALYRISKHQRRNGHKCWKFKRGYQHLKTAKQHFRQLAALDASFEI